MPVPALQRRVTSWSVVNLLDIPTVATYAACPVIVCRNAFIYFSPQSVKKVVEVFADHMLAPGYLLVGASESLLNMTDRFALEDLDHAFAYVKR